MDYAVDVPVTAVSWGVPFLLYHTWPVNTEKTWQHQLLPMDDRVKDLFSTEAALVSDVTLAASILAPPVALMASDIGTSGDAILVYAESLGASFLVNTVVSSWCSVPGLTPTTGTPACGPTPPPRGRRPICPSTQATPLYRSPAAVSGSYLFGMTNDNPAARAAIWGMELALASMTANLRVRAGKHFYSDVIVGAIVGAGLGFAVTYLHEDSGERYQPTAAEWGAMGGGLIAGILISELIPFRDWLSPPAEKEGKEVTMSFLSTCTFSPMSLKDGAGLVVAGRF